MKLIKPPKLNAGDVIGLISPASSPDDLNKIDKGVSYLESIGYRVELGKNVGIKNGYLAGTDEQRLEDLHYMFENKHVKAIFSIRGGYGSIRLLDKINYNLVKRNPKIFVGYSDINALQMAFLKKCGLVTFAGPMVTVDFHEQVSEFTEEIFWRTITSNKKIGRLKNPSEEKFFVLRKGRGAGNLIGGNLTIFTSLIGTEYLPQIKTPVFIFEEINEPPYKVDRMFNHIRLAKLFNNVQAVILGRFVDCYETDKNKASLTLNEVILEYFEKIGVPVIYNVKHGHIKDNITIPFGLQCIVNGSKGFIEIPESGVV